MIFKYITLYCLLLFQERGEYRISVSCATRKIKEMSEALMSYLGFNKVIFLLTALIWDENKIDKIDVCFTWYILV